MDNHERGWERREGRLDIPLPDWRGSYGGDPRRLPRVVQKLLRGHKLTAEEKAELLWRFYELDQETRVARRKRTAAVVALGLVLVGATTWMLLHPPEWLAQSIADLLEQSRS